MKYNFIFKEDIMRFGEKLRDLRKGKDMTQTDLAKEIGVSLRTIISYENSNSYPKKQKYWNIFL